jgi:hypothetical protein
MLMNWASPFTEETNLKQKHRQKIVTSKQLNATEDEPLANYTPPTPERIQQKHEAHPKHEESNIYEAPPIDFSYKSQNSDLLEKLNYMIYLLEEQRDEKTGQVTEELILYVFLGIFTLFVLDTFVKNGKYSR